jgi:mRNA interferase MazF
VVKNLHKIYPFETLLPMGTGNLPKQSKVKADQIRILDKSRIVKHIGDLPKDIVHKIEKAVAIHLDINIAD